MTSPGGPDGPRPAAAATTARRRVSGLLQGSGLQITERAHELVIANPLNPERGQIHVAYEDGYVCWERTAWSYWGHLQGYQDRHTDTAPPVTAAKIAETLGSSLPPGDAPAP
ncbi:MAG TPA: hypothetical protein VGI31_00010 [Streptosporangiaceae bacterium]